MQELISWLYFHILRMNAKTIKVKINGNEYIGKWLTIVNMEMELEGSSAPMYDIQEFMDNFYDIKEKHKF